MYTGTRVQIEPFVEFWRIWTIISGKDILEVVDSEQVAHVSIDLVREVNRSAWMTQLEPD